MTTLSGPMFEPTEDEWQKAIFDKKGAHYNIFATKGPEEATALLQHFFPEGQVNELNFVLFSTSGVHGDYTTLEEIEESLQKYGDNPSFDTTDWNEDWPDDYTQNEITFLLIQPRLVCMRYGNAKVTTDNIEFFKKLQRTSHEVVQQIGLK